MRPYSVIAVLASLAVEAFVGLQLMGLVVKSDTTLVAPCLGHIANRDCMSLDHRVILAQCPR